MWFTAETSGMLEMKNFTSANMKGRTYVRTYWRADDYVTTKFSWMHRWPVVRATSRTGYMMTSPKFLTWRPNQGTRIRVAFQLFATPRNDLVPQYLRSCAFEWWGSTWVWKKMATNEVCVFSRGKTVERECFSSKIYLTRRKTFEDRKVSFNFLIFEKKFMKSS